MSSSSITYFYHRLDRIQFALERLRAVDRGIDLHRLIETLEKDEDQAVRDLVEAENTDDE